MKTTCSLYKPLHPLTKVPRLSHILPAGQNPTLLEYEAILRQSFSLRSASVNGAFAVVSSAGLPLFVPGPKQAGNVPAGQNSSLFMTSEE